MTIDKDTTYKHRGYDIVKDYETLSDHVHTTIYKTCWNIYKDGKKIRRGNDKRIFGERWRRLQDAKKYIDELEGIEPKPEPEFKPISLAKMAFDKTARMKNVKRISDNVLEYRGKFIYLAREKTKNYYVIFVANTPNLSNDEVLKEKLVCIPTEDIDYMIDREGK